MALELSRLPGYAASTKGEEEEQRQHEAELREKLKELSSGTTTVTTGAS